MIENLPHDPDIMIQVEDLTDALNQVIEVLNKLERQLIEHRHTHGAAYGSTHAQALTGLPVIEFNETNPLEEEK